MRAGSKYLLVKVDPPVTTRFWDGPSTGFDRMVLATIANRTLQDIGTRLVMADIVICPIYAGGPLDERLCSRIGVGSLHATYAEALKSSPLEAE